MNVTISTLIVMVTVAATAMILIGPFSAFAALPAVQPTFASPVSTASVPGTLSAARPVTDASPQGILLAGVSFGGGISFGRGYVGGYIGGGGGGIYIGGPIGYGPYRDYPDHGWYNDKGERCYWTGYEKACYGRDGERSD